MSLIKVIYKIKLIDTSPCISKFSRWRYVSTFRNVDLPAPLDPMIARRVPGSTPPVTKHKLLKGLTQFIQDF